MANLLLSLKQLVASQHRTIRSVLDSSGAPESSPYRNRIDFDPFYPWLSVSGRDLRLRDTVLFIEQRVGAIGDWRIRTRTGQTSAVPASRGFFQDLRPLAFFVWLLVIKTFRILDFSCPKSTANFD